MAAQRWLVCPLGYVSRLILYLRCKFHGSIPNDCQDIANLLLGNFNLGHPVFRYLYAVADPGGKGAHVPQSSKFAASIGRPNSQIK